MDEEEQRRKAKVLKLLSDLFDSSTINIVSSFIISSIFSTNDCYVDNLSRSIGKFAVRIYKALNRLVSCSIDLLNPEVLAHLVY